MEKVMMNSDNREDEVKPAPHVFRLRAPTPGSASDICRECSLAKNHPIHATIAAQDWQRDADRIERGGQARNVSPQCRRGEHGDCECSALICRCECHRVEIGYAIPAENLLDEPNAADAATHVSVPVSTEEWLPIGTAPKTGEKILLAHDNSVWVDEWWDGSFWLQCGTNGTHEGEVPTYWRPMPPPPESTSLTFRTTKEAMLWAQRNNVPAVVPATATSTTTAPEGERAVQVPLCPNDGQVMELHQSFYRSCRECGYREGVAAPSSPSEAVRAAAAEWMNTWHGAFATNKEREDALVAILSRYFGKGETDAPNTELRSACCDAPTRIANTDYNVCTACKEACDTTTAAAPAAPSPAGPRTEIETRAGLLPLSLLDEIQERRETLYKGFGYEHYAPQMKTDLDHALAIAAALRTSVEGESE